MRTVQIRKLQQIMPNLTHEISPIQHFIDFSMNEINSEGNVACFYDESVQINMGSILPPITVKTISELSPHPGQQSRCHCRYCHCASVLQILQTVSLFDIHITWHHRKELSGVKAEILGDCGMGPPLPTTDTWNTGMASSTTVLLQASAMHCTAQYNRTWHALPFSNICNVLSMSASNPGVTDMGARSERNWWKWECWPVSTWTRQFPRRPSGTGWENTAGHKNVKDSLLKDQELLT